MAFRSGYLNLEFEFILPGGCFQDQRLQYCSANAPIGNCDWARNHKTHSGGLLRLLCRPGSRVMCTPARRWSSRRGCGSRAAGGRRSFLWSRSGSAARWCCHRRPCSLARCRRSHPQLQRQVPSFEAAGRPMASVNWGVFAAANGTDLISCCGEKFLTS